MTNSTLRKSFLVLTLLSMTSTGRIFAEHQPLSKPSQTSASLACCGTDPVCEPDVPCAVSIYSR